MNRAILDLKAKAVTRRSVLRGAFASVVASMVPPKALAKIAGFDAASGKSDDWNPAPDKADLYAFPGVQPGTTVIAATWSVRLNRFGWIAHEESHVTIHVGSQRWNVDLPGGATDAGLSEQRGCRVFAGTVATRPGVQGVALGAVVLEIPETSQRSSGSMDIWAERVMETGSRQRIGSPFVAALVAKDARLASSYHSISPPDDRALLTAAVSKAIATKARASGMAGDPEAHGRRLALRLLPDVLHYDPHSPFGFTFAAQNGRHPEEASALVVDTILSGSPAAGPAKADLRLQESFPFFSRHGSAA